MQKEILKYTVNFGGRTRYRGTAEGALRFMDYNIHTQAVALAVSFPVTNLALLEWHEAHGLLRKEPRVYRLQLKRSARRATENGDRVERTAWRLASDCLRKDGTSTDRRPMLLDYTDALADDIRHDLDIYRYQIRAEALKYRPAQADILTRVFTAMKLARLAAETHRILVACEDSIGRLCGLDPAPMERRIREVAGMLAGKEEFAYYKNKTLCAAGDILMRHATDHHRMERVGAVELGINSAEG